MATFFDRLRSIITSKSQNTSEQYNRAIYNWLGNTIVWNSENDETYINDGYRKNATIYSIVNIITKAASTIPYHIYRKVNDNSYKRYKAMSSGIADPNVMLKSNMLKKHALVELEHTDLHKLLERPNPAQSYATWITEMIAFGKLTGNRYIYGIGPETGENINKYTELYIMPSQIMEINSGGIMKPVESYTIEYNGTYHIPADQMCHIKDFNPFYDGTGSHLYGQSPLKAGLRSMTTNNEATESGVKFLQNQTARGLLMSDEGDLNEVQAQQLKDKFRKEHQGSKKAGDIIITPKKLSWVNFGLNASDMSLIEQYNASIKDLCNIYNVPVQLLNNTESSTYNNMKEAKKALYQNCVIPELLKIKDELNRWLAPMYGDDICIEYDFSVIPELQEETDKIVDQMSKAWWLTPNEKRAAMSYDHDEQNPILNDYYIPANLIPASGDDIDMPDVVETPINDIEVDIDNEDDTKKKNLITNTNIKSLVSGMTDVYTTQQEAEDRAIELGGSGSHQHTYDGEPVFMPFESHDEYMDAVDNEKYDEYKAEGYSDYPQSATNNAKRVKNWIDKHGRDEVDGMTSIGLSRMNQLIAREKLSLSTLKRTFSFLSRTKGGGYNKINPKFKDTPWRDKGYVAFLGWGGQSMLTYSERKLNQIKE
jgi:HK97 family phage portal protein